MNWKCLFGHHWRHVSHAACKMLFDSQYSHTETRILMKCKKCHEFKLTIVYGDFSEVSDEDMK